MQAKLRQLSQNLQICDRCPRICAPLNPVPAPVVQNTAEYKVRNKYIFRECSHVPINRFDMRINGLPSYHFLSCFAPLHLLEFCLTFYWRISYLQAHVIHSKFTHTHPANINSTLQSAISLACLIQNELYVNVSCSRVTEWKKNVKKIVSTEPSGILVIFYEEYFDK